ncbi:hypothetical protein HID58_069860 [Brassica napus]|uniref:Replication protein A 70 kDa DNA-binding subunit B/D first OB fold domain-containing protein n=1 Tax=Brassica napus TaxID=3708 RepID=A0ABQ7YX40_BRANA|nr:hypothetical protein HID58_069860 [Brassica napus]
MKTVTSPTISIHLIHTETKLLFPHTPIMAAITAVSDLKPFKSMWKIQVKIIRLWKQYSVDGGLTIEMVLIDSNGVKINASVKKDLIVEVTPIEVVSANGKETHKLTVELRNEKDERLPMVLWVISIV